MKPQSRAVTPLRLLRLFGFLLGLALLVLDLEHFALSGDVNLDAFAISEFELRLIDCRTAGLLLVVASHLLEFALGLVVLDHRLHCGRAIGDADRFVLCARRVDRECKGNCSNKCERLFGGHDVEGFCDSLGKQVSHVR